jgi:hypothetical protein
MPTDVIPVEYHSLAMESKRVGMSAEWFRLQGRLGNLRVYRAGKKMLVKPGDVDRLLESRAK